MWWWLLFVIICGSLINSACGLSNWTRWTQLGACSVSCGAGAIWQKRTCIGDNPNPVCPGAQQRTRRCQKLACPENQCNCGCSLTGASGNIRSVSPSKKSLDCTWNIKTKYGTKIKLTVNNFILKYGNLWIVGPRKVYHTLSRRRNENIPVPFTVQSEGNQLNLSLHYHKVIQDGNGVKLEASYETLYILPDEELEPQKKSGVNVPTVAGISACVVIIMLVTCLIIYRRRVNRGKNQDNAEEDGEDENCASSTSTSIKHGGVDLFWDQRDSASQKQSLQSEKHISANLNLDNQRLLLNQGNILTARMNPTAVPMYINAATLNGQIGYNPQYNQQYVLLPTTANIMNQQQLSCTPRDMTSG